MRHKTSAIGVSFMKKFVLASTFAAVTSLGMLSSAAYAAGEVPCEDMLVDVRAAIKTATATLSARRFSAGARLVRSRVSKKSPNAAKRSSSSTMNAKINR